MPEVLRQMGIENEIGGKYGLIITPFICQVQEIIDKVYFIKLDQAERKLHQDFVLTYTFMPRIVAKIMDGL